MKYLIVLMFLLMVGCGNRTTVIDESVVKRAEQKCKDQGGILMIKVSVPWSMKDSRSYYLRKTLSNFMCKNGLETGWMKSDKEYK